MKNGMSDEALVRMASFLKLQQMSDEEEEAQYKAEEEAKLQQNTQQAHDLLNSINPEALDDFFNDVAFYTKSNISEMMYTEEGYAKHFKNKNSISVAVENMSYSSMPGGFEAVGGMSNRDLLYDFFKKFDDPTKAEEVFSDGHGYSLMLDFIDSSWKEYIQRFYPPISDLFDSYPSVIEGSENPSKQVGQYEFYKNFQNSWVVYDRSNGLFLDEEDQYNNPEVSAAIDELNTHAPVKRPRGRPRKSI